MTWIIVDDSPSVPIKEAFRIMDAWRRSSMTPDQFSKWLAEMKSAGLARSDAECARLLGISANSVVALKKNGADLRTALACRALLHRLEPYA